MAITRINNANSNDSNPGYNNLTYFFTSTNKAKKGFRYVAEIKDRLNNLIFEKTIIPSINTGDCHLQLDNELSNYLSFSFDTSKFNGTNYNAVDSYLHFKISMGEEYFYEHNWNEYVFASPITTYWPNGNNPAYNPGLKNRTALVSSSNTAPIFNIGDWIYVNQPITNDVTKSLNGSKKILDIVNVGATIPSVGYVGWMIVLDLNWIGSSTTSGGTIRFDDNRKTKTSNLLTVDNQLVYNGYINSRDYINYDQDDFLMTTTGSNINALTILPENNYICREDDYLMVNYLSKNLPIPEMAARVIFENDSGDKSYQALTKSALWGVSQVDVSPRRTNWGTNISGTNPILKSNTKYYSFYFADNSNTRISKKYTVDIDRSCKSIDALKLVFIDKLGSFLSYNFDARNFEDRDIKKEMYTQHLGKVGASGYEYTTMDAGEKTYHQKTSTSFELNTGYLSDEMSDFFINVAESPISFVEIDGKLVRCNITSSSIPLKKIGWHEQKRYKIKIKLSNDEGINI